MQLAHTAGGSGPNIEFLILAGGMLVLGIVFFMQKSVKPIVSLVLVLGSFALGAGAFAFDGEESPSSDSVETTIEIVDPSGGDTVPANEPFQVEVGITGGSLTSQAETDDPTAGHLHVYVDDQLVSMPSTGTPEVELTPGEHKISVEFTAADHHSFDPKIIDHVQVTAE